MPFRDDLAAAQARVAVLAQENAELRDLNTALQVRDSAPLAKLAVRREDLTVLPEYVLSPKPPGLETTVCWGT